jgi:signal peptidase I
MDFEEQDNHPVSPATEDTAGDSVDPTHDASGPSPSPSPAVADIETPERNQRDGAAQESHPENIKKSRARRAAEEAWDWAKSVAVALALALLIKTFLVQAYVIPTGSMEPTIEPGDRVFGSRITYRFDAPQRGDIIAFIPPPEVRRSMQPLAPGTLASRFNKDKEYDYSYLKRAIAVEGDAVGVFGGRVFLNGKPLDEPYLKNGLRACPYYDDFPIRIVPEGMLLALGDNRCNSHDGHKWGFLPKKNVQAKAFFRFWPPGRIGAVR